MSEAKKPDKPATPDWERIEGDYRAGVKTLRQIADQHGITHGAINKRAKRDGWDRDIGPKIQARADALVSRAQVSSEVSRRVLDTSKDIIEANAQAIVQVRMGHRKDAARARTLVGKLWSELDGITDHHDLAVQLGEVMSGEGGKDAAKMQAAYDRIVAIPGRIDGAKKLADALRTVISIEREAFDIKAPEDGPPATPAVSADALKDLAPGDAYLLMVRGGK